MRKRKKWKALLPTKLVKRRLGIYQKKGNFGIFGQMIVKMMGDFVVVNPPSRALEPTIATIKDIIQRRDGTMKVVCQWLYYRKDTTIEGVIWETHKRELFYSFHREEIPTEWVMDQCQVNFFPPNEQIPDWFSLSGFLVKRVYDHCEGEVWNVPNTDFDEEEHRELAGLLQKTRERWERVHGSSSSRQIPAVETPHTAGECYQILREFKALTGVSKREIYLKELLNVCYSHKEDENCWLENVVRAVVALEKATNDALHKNKIAAKMRPLCFNLESNARLTRWLIQGKLESAIVVKMTPQELKMTGLDAQGAMKRE